MKITNIAQFTGPNDPKNYMTPEGYEVSLDDGSTIRLWIDGESSCCESFGYFMSEDNLNDYIGAELIDIERVDTALLTHKVSNINNIENGALDCGDVMFINLNTSKGILQFVAYNAHNGYYGHYAGVISRIYNHSTVL